MIKHLFGETTYAPPTCVIDIIQSYANWAEKNISHRTTKIINDINENDDINEKMVEHIEEYVFHDTTLHINHILAVKTVLSPKNPSIVLLEVIVPINTSSIIDMIVDDYDQTYLEIPKAIKIMAGRNVITIPEDQFD